VNEHENEPRRNGRGGYTVSGNLPKAKRVQGGTSPVVYVLIGAIVVLILGIGLLLFSGDIFDDQPSSQAERDYQLLIEGLQDDPENVAVLMTLAETEMELGRETDAIGHAEKAWELGQETPGIPLRYAQVMVQVGEKDVAIVAIEKEIELDVAGANAEPLFLLAQIHREDGDYEAAIATMEKALAIEYMAADMRILYADILAEAGREDEAIEQYEEALRFLPGDERAIEGLRILGISVEATEGVDPHGEAPVEEDQ
jgi:tetratricopeptide (TPR) repeat protein